MGEGVVCAVKAMDWGTIRRSIKMNVPRVDRMRKMG